MEQQAAALGKPVVELERDRRYIYSKAQVHDRPYTAKQNPPQQNRKST
jgi:hypothetical protein